MVDHRRRSGSSDELLMTSLPGFHLFLPPAHLKQTTVKIVTVSVHSNVCISKAEFKKTRKSSFMSRKYSVTRVTFVR